MTPDRHRKLMHLLGDALDRGAAGRADWVREAAGGDEGLADEVIRLLGRTNEAELFLEDSPIARLAADTESGSSLVGRHVGPYTLTRVLGRGGMGTAFLAERSDSEFNRQVAIKLINRGMDTDAVLKRFRTERQILAALDHPYIARLIDGGTTGDGLPYFVMEYVEGVTIDESCRERGLNRTLALFRKVCSAVSFAHEKLIVHRDLKPSNILVNADEEPKLLDFGIAKLLDTDDGVTQTQFRALTPAYASPEQLAGLNVTTATDVYSLGKILAVLIDCENPGSTKSSVPRDLRNIVAKAIHEDVSRRYGSVESLSEDVRRYLENLPVLARSDSFRYRTEKFVRRNRLKLVFAGLLLLTLAGGMAATVSKANEARRERQLAEQRFDNLRRLSDSFITEIHGAIENLPGSLPARRLLLRRATEQLDSMAAEPGENRDLRADLAQAYAKLAGLPDMELTEKKQTLAKSMSIYDSLVREAPENDAFCLGLAMDYVEAADAEKVTGSIADAVEDALRAIEIFEALSVKSPGDLPTKRQLYNAVSTAAAFRRIAGDPDGSMALVQRGQAILADMKARGLPAEESESLDMRAHLQLGAASGALGRHDLAVSEFEIARRGLAQQRGTAGNDTSKDYYLWATDRRLAEELYAAGDAAGAMRAASEGVSIIDDLAASSPHDVGYNRNSALTHILLGSFLVRSGSHQEAIRHYRTAHALSEKNLAGDRTYFESKIDLAGAKAGLGYALARSGASKDGEALLAEALRLYDELSGIDTANSVLRADRENAVAWYKEISNRRL